MLLRHGAGSTLNLLILPALFEEANRMRRFTVSMMRGLADCGIGSILPDLPGTGESLIAINNVTIDDWREACAAAAKHVDPPLLTVSIRGGALMDGIADFGWRLAPETGARLVRDMLRATKLSDQLSTTGVDSQASERPTSLAGNGVGPGLFGKLSALAPINGHYRTAQVTDNADECDLILPGAKLWRAAESSDDPEFVAAAVADIASWAKTCAGF